MSFISVVQNGRETWVLSAFPSIWPCILAGLAIVLLISGVDDLIPLAIRVWHHLRNRGPAMATLGKHLFALEAETERRIAIFVPCWRESGVIGSMIRHNLAAIRYRHFDFFLGVYPNDELTVASVEELAASFGSVHLAACPHPGPTSKADCLNWIYQRMLLYEEQNAAHFDTVVLHDAEDLIHPDALSLINRERARYAMVQVPVLPIPTSGFEFTHGVYCDEFAEYQMIDMPARQLSRSFIPSNGVGTGFAREILDQLASERKNCVFDPASLTEDYETGVYIHNHGHSQLFAPLVRGERDFTATREYFPRKLKSAIRQRTRWITGIALQCWERHGWRGSWRTKYWFWRDRKGLFTNPLTLLTNALFLAGIEDWIASAISHRPWAFAVSNPKIVLLCEITLLLQGARLALRTVCVAKIFGPSFALGVPLRVFHGNLVNCLASLGAFAQYASSRLQRRPLVWLKTEHAYPNRGALVLHQRDLRDVLAASGYVSDEVLTRVQSQVPVGADLADFLLARKLISEEDLCKAISLQSGVPAGNIDPRRVRRGVVRSLPAHVERRFGVVPCALRAGRLVVAGARVPPSACFEELKSFTRLPVDFQLVTSKNYEQLRALL